MIYLKSGLIQQAQGVVVESAAHLNVPAVSGVTLVPVHPHYASAFRASVDPDARVLDAGQATAALVEVLKAGTAHVTSHKDELASENKRVFTALSECEKLVNQNVSSSTDLRADADLVAEAKRDAAQVAGRQLDTTADVYVAARAVAGRCDGLEELCTVELKKTVEQFERSLASLETQVGRARRQLESFASVEQKLADPSRQGAASDLRRAMATQQRVDQLATRLDSVRSDLRTQLGTLDQLAAELGHLRQGAAQ